KLKDIGVKARLAGMEVTDQVHWIEHFRRDGTYRVWSMGEPRTGKWRIAKGELCIDDEMPNPETCTEVWLSGNKIQFRLPGGFVAREAFCRRNGRADTDPDELLVPDEGEIMKKHVTVSMSVAGMLLALGNITPLLAESVNFENEPPGQPPSGWNI